MFSHVLNIKLQTDGCFSFLHDSCIQPCEIPDPMTVSLDASQELFSGVVKISLALFSADELNSINLGGFVNSIAYSQNLKIIVDFCRIHPRSPSGMLMAKRWRAFFWQPNVLIHFLSWNQISLQTNWIEPLNFYLDFTHIFLESRFPMWVSENSVPLNPMVLLIIIPIKWLFHWEYTQHFQTNPWYFPMAPYGPMAIVLTFSEVPPPGGSQRHHHLCRDQPGRQLCGLGGVGGTGGDLGGFAWFWRDFGDFWLILMFFLMILVILSFCEGFLLDFGWIWVAFEYWWTNGSATKANRTGGFKHFSNFQQGKWDDNPQWSGGLKPGGGLWHQMMILLYSSWSSWRGIRVRYGLSLKHSAPPNWRGSDPGKKTSCKK